MIKLKKYVNGQFFDTINKKYIKVATLKEMIEKGEKIKVTLTKTGKDITDSVIKQFSKTDKKDNADKGKKADEKKTTETKKVPFLNTDALKKWAGRVIDDKVVKMLDTMQLPNKKQIEQLNANIKALHKKIADFEKFQKQKNSKAKSEKQTT